MRIAGISNFYVSTINNRLDLRNVKRAKLEVNIPEPHHKNVYTYVSGFETYSNKSMSNFLTTFRNIEAKGSEWQCDTIALPTGETFQLKQLKQFKYDNSENLRKINVVNLIDIQI
ncbi:hypothetical protein [Clostridium formicaceticum]|uniref:Uncharacterized protein n=1 Tax=Clostridium formicaceticum TaxID=1497 RepID=A0AAC9WGW6_9CLOT|nr:hypothetical protein [Clostridium formicaceticum]AOY77727.1 hypothetical protein BJL90_18815 [Clostridium formicaceticum]ARE88321.1 hypothetical protein CLFO_27220 [Clostridium formicaceticum]